MATLRFSVDALDDLRSIHAWIAQDSGKAADDVVRKVFARCQEVCDSPESGHIYEELNLKDSRTVSVHSYLIFYRIERHEIHVARILHGAGRIGPTDFAGVDF